MQKAVGYSLTHEDRRIVRAADTFLGVGESVETTDADHSVLAGFKSAVKAAFYREVSSEINEGAAVEERPTASAKEEIRDLVRGIRDFRSIVDDTFHPSESRVHTLGRITVGSLLVTRVILLAVVIPACIIAGVWAGTGWWTTDINYRAIYLTSVTDDFVIQDPADFTSGTNFSIAWFFFAVFLVHIVAVVLSVLYSWYKDGGFNPLMHYLKVVHRRDVDIFFAAECLIYYTTFHWLMTGLLGIRDPILSGAILVLSAVASCAILASEFYNAAPLETVNVGGRDMVNPQFSVMPSVLRPTRQHAFVLSSICIATVAILEGCMLIRYPWHPLPYSTVFSYVMLIVSQSLICWMHWWYIKSVDIEMRTTAYMMLRPKDGESLANHIIDTINGDRTVTEWKSRIPERFQEDADNLIQWTGWEYATHIGFNPGMRKNAWTSLGCLTLATMICCFFWSIFAQTRGWDFNPQWAF